MKKLILLAVLTVFFNMSSHADWDAAGEAREAAARKVEQQRAAKQKAEHNKMLREASAKAYRKELGKEAVGKSDAEVERIYKQRQDAVVKQAVAFEAAMKTSQGQPKKRGDAAGMEQGDAAMKAMYGKSVNDIGNMSEKEREAFFKDMERKYSR